MEPFVRSNRPNGVKNARRTAGLKSADARDRAGRDRRAHQEPFFAALCCAYSRLPIVLFWVAVAVVVNVIARRSRSSARLHSAPMAPEEDARRCRQAMEDDGPTTSRSSTQQQPHGPRGPAASRPGRAQVTTNAIIASLQQDPTHIQHIPDLRGDTLTAAAPPSARRQGLLRDDQHRGAKKARPGPTKRRGVGKGHRTLRPARVQGMSRGARPRHRRPCTSSGGKRPSPWRRSLDNPRAIARRNVLVVYRSIRTT